MLIAVLGLILAAAFVPLPGPTEIRGWARSVGPMFPLAFFLAHTVICVAPFPRTAFTVSAGLLFGPTLGIGIAVSATTLSALLALLLVRAAGRDAVSARLTHPAVQAVDSRLAHRGWLAVGSMRLIAPLPFSIVNYCCGISSVRVVPYLIATSIGVLPGTIGVVILGDALTGHVSPWLLLFSGACIAVGLAGLAADLLTAVPDTRNRASDTREGATDTGTVLGTEAGATSTADGATGTGASGTADGATGTGASGTADGAGLRAGRAADRGLGSGNVSANTRQGV